MTTKDLRNNIDKVLGNSIRCLLPSYWWKRLFHQVADTIDEVVDTIDDINDISIVGSESELSKLDVPSGSVASVYNERKFKFSECYSITPEDSNLSDDEIFAKCTRIKAIDVNYDSLSEIDCTKLDAAFFFASYENNQLELTGALYVTGGVPLFVVITNVGTDTVFPLNSIAGQTRCNEYLSQHDMRYIGFEGSTEERLILESIFSVVEADIDVYVKGTSWEKLANDTLISGETIKTINGESILGSGDLTIEVGSDITVDTTLSTTSTNPVQNKVITSALDNKVDKASGKQLSTEDFTTTLKTKLESLSNYDDTQLESSINTLRSDFDKLVSGDTTTAIKTFNEVIAFLDGISDTQDLEGIIASIQQQIAGKQDTISDLDTIRSGAALGATALQEHQQLKTINGQSIIGSGDIEIGADVSALATKEELQNEVNTLVGIIQDNEDVTATAFNEINERINSFRSNVTEVNATKEELINTEKNINSTIVENEEISAAALVDLANKIKVLEQRIQAIEEA